MKIRHGRMQEFSGIRFERPAHPSPANNRTIHINPFPSREQELFRPLRGGAEGRKVFLGEGGPHGRRR